MDKAYTSFPDQYPFPDIVDRTPFNHNVYCDFIEHMIYKHIGRTRL